MRHVLRQLVTSPGYTAVCIITLALGIGLNTSMFSLLNTLLLQPIPYPDRDQLVRIYRTTPQSQTSNHPAADYVELTRALAGPTRVAAYQPWSFSLAIGDRAPVNLNALRVSADFLPLLGLQPELGRYFTNDEDKPGNHVVILSHATWQAQFGGDRDIIGRTVRVDGEPTTIIGVTPQAFSSVFLWGPTEALRPLALTDGERLDTKDAKLSLIARLPAGTTVGQFNAQLATTTRQLALTRPAERREDGLTAVSLQSSAVNSSTRGMLCLLIALAAFVLLIACANLANLQLARTVARSHEFAVRAALGANRLALLRPVIAECVMLALAGGGLGLLIAAWSNDWMGSRMSANGVVTFTFQMDWTVIAFAASLSAATGVAFGLVPTFLLGSIRANEALKSGTRGNTGGRAHHRFRHTLIVGQFALALILLAGAGLVIGNFRHMLEREIGWNQHSLIQGVVSLPQTKYATPAQTYAFYTHLLERLRGLPGAENATIGWTLPVYTMLTTRGFVVEGRPPPESGHEPLAYVNGVMPSYFATLQIRLLAGRNFTDADNATAKPVVIINESMAKALFPQQNPVGKRIGSTDPANRGWAEIVGVMPDLRNALSVLVPASPFMVFRPLAQETWNYVSFAVRAPAAETLATPIRQLVAELDRDLPVQQLNTVDETVKLASAGFQMVNTILVIFASLGLFLAALGLYGTIARVVAQRMPELGIRVALGAQPGDVVWLVLRTGVILTGIGAAIGVAGSFALAHVLASLTPEPGPVQPGPIAIVAAVLVAVALVAAWIPARRATRVDPLVALRAE
jgi:predicted permease